MNSFMFQVLWILGHVLFSLGALYLIIVSFPAYLRGRKKYVTNSAPDIEDITKALDGKGLDEIPVFKFQITTIGNETDVVARGIRSILELADPVPALLRRKALV